MKNNRKKMRMLIDFDDVLCPCAELAVAQWNKEHTEEDPMTVDEIREWGWTGTRTDELLEYYKDPHSECYRLQKPYKGSVKFIEKLQKIVDVYICTAVPPEVTEFRIRQIRKFFPMISKANIIIASRKDLIAAESFQFMLDDSPEHITNSKADYTIMWRQPWNERITGILAAQVYDDVISIVDMVIRDEIGLNNPPRAPFLYVLVGTSGSGKNQVIRKLMELGYVKVRSYTTKAEEMNEEDEYFAHVTKDEFFSLIVQNKVSEFTRYAGNYFGTDVEFVMNRWKEGRNCIMAADISGAMMLKKTLNKGYGPDSCRVVTVYCERDRYRTIQSILNREMPNEEKALRLAYLDAERANQAICDISVNTDDASRAAEELDRLWRGECLPEE